ncbi:PTS hybrid protein [Streptomyces sp. V4I23]|uniref:dihydroxyacetone kinase phosphoryl donor subunit DhaM n=1 Tax=Streptomyces sp. V4I23 TaxID=3042282 RepID=UPI00277EE451|nr:dihydroxyacetone kinase phosphoryl donor subunit DhaM [Streptomyces sp. V4I23]MDQ1006876.1 PTS hybrid protein [Streptomyces sp. V4I23]
MSAHVGIVLVSHSAELAAGLRPLVEQIGSDVVSVVSAAGTDDGSIGTSYDLVLNATKDADRGAGVLVLPDLGSSVLTTRTVLVPPDVVIVDAPFVEDAVAAVVAAASGADPQTVANSTEKARHVRKL